MTSLVPTGMMVGVDTRSSHYQDLKGRIHQELLNRLDLDRLARMRREDAEPEIRGLIIGMIEREENSPTVDTLEKLAAVLKIEPKLFFADDELISEAVRLHGSTPSTRKGPLAREGGGGSRRRPGRT